MKPFCQTTLHAGDVLHRRFVDRGRHRARDRRPDHRVRAACRAPSRRPCIRCVPSTFGGDVAPPRAGLADGLVFARRLRLGLALDHRGRCRSSCSTRARRRNAARRSVRRRRPSWLASFLSLTTPSVTVSRSAGTPSFSDAISTQHATRFGGGVAHRRAALPDAGRAGGAAHIDGQVGGGPAPC